MDDRTIPRYSVVKFQTTEDKEKILQASRKRRQSYVKKGSEL